MAYRPPDAAAYESYVTGNPPDYSQSIPDAVAYEEVGNPTIRGGMPDDNMLSQSRYDFTSRAFPSDLGMSYAGHYMVINVNVPITVTSARFRNDPVAATDIQPMQFTMDPNELSKVDVLRFGRGGSTTATNSDSLTTRRTRRIVESIALYMPGTQLVYNGMNTYEEISMTALGGQLLTGALTNAGIIAGYFGAGGAIGGALGNLAQKIGAPAFASAVGNALGGAASTTLSVAEQGFKLMGRPINPRVEVLFSLTPLRDFQFEFLMIPRNEDESMVIRNIVRTLRFHAAPELDNYGLNFIPPAEFDITFYNAGKENTMIPRINTCVLTRCEVDYAPGTGTFSSFRNGAPIATRLMLVFREVEPVHKLRVLQGF